MKYLSKKDPGAQSTFGFLNLEPVITYDHMNETPAPNHMVKNPGRMNLVKLICEELAIISLLTLCCLVSL